MSAPNHPSKRLDPPSHSGNAQIEATTFSMVLPNKIAKFGDTRVTRFSDPGMTQKLKQDAILHQNVTETAFAILAMFYLLWVAKQHSVIAIYSDTRNLRIWQSTSLP